MNHVSMTSEQVAEVFNTSVDKVNAFAACGQLPGAKIGKGWVFLQDDVFAFLQALIQEQTLERRTQGGFPGEDQRIQSITEARRVGGRQRTSTR